MVHDGVVDDRQQQMSVSLLAQNSTPWIKWKTESRYQWLVFISEHDKHEIKFKIFNGTKLNKNYQLNNDRAQTSCFR